MPLADATQDDADMQLTTPSRMSLGLSGSLGLSARTVHVGVALAGSIDVAITLL